MLRVLIRGVTYHMDIIDIPGVCYITSRRKSSHSYSFSLFFYDSRFICERSCIRSLKQLNIEVQFLIDIYLNNVVQNDLEVSYEI